MPCKYTLPTAQARLCRQPPPTTKRGATQRMSKPVPLHFIANFKDAPPKRFGSKTNFPPTNGYSMTHHRGIALQASAIRPKSPQLDHKEGIEFVNDLHNTLSETPTGIDASSGGEHPANRVFPMFRPICNRESVAAVFVPLRTRLLNALSTAQHCMHKFSSMHSETICVRFRDECAF